MRVVLDTNVLVSAILFGGRPRVILDRVIAGDIELVTSPRLLDELQGVLAQKFKTPPASASRIRREIEQIALLVEPDEVPAIARDHDDDHVLAAAVFGRAVMVVTGDRDLLVLTEHQGVRILSPADAERLLAAP